MNMRREALIWSIAITAAIALGLVVVWAAIALAFSRPNFAPLYFAAAPYRQDDYSAEGVETARLNPLDPNLEQEVILEDKARGVPVFNVNYDLPIALPVSVNVTQPEGPTIVPLEPINVPPPAPTIAPPEQTLDPISAPPNNGNGSGNPNPAKGGGNSGGGNGGGGNGGGNDSGGNGGGNGNKP